MTRNKLIHQALKVSNAIDSHDRFLTELVNTPSYYYTHVCSEKEYENHVIINTRHLNRLIDLFNKIVNKLTIDK